MPRTMTNGVISKTDDGEFLKKRGRGKKKPAPKTKTSPIKFLADTDIKCRICSNTVDDQGDGIDCDRCNGWVHLTCSKVTQKEYKWLSDNPTDAFKHFCKLCEEELKGTKDNATAQQNAKIEHLTEIVKTVTDQNKIITDQNKIILELLQQSKINSEVQPKPARKDDVQSQIKEVLYEHQEKEEKQQNVIIFNIPESKQDTDKKIELEDTDKAADIIHFLDDSDTPPQDIIVTRIGRKRGEENPRPRPVKVTLTNTKQKDKILRNVRHLKHYTKHSRIGISHDKTRKEINEDRRLWAELKRKREADPDKDYVIFDKNVVLKTDIPNIKKQDKNEESLGTSPTKQPPADK